MTKKEKLSAFLILFTMILIVTSAIYTFYQIKPVGYSFRIEKILYNFK